MMLYDVFTEEQMKDVPDGTAGIGFPITAYDRPAISISNLLMRGDIPASFKAYLAPYQLSPAELKTISEALQGKDKKRPSKIWKTITDIGTNPLVWLGTFLAIKYGGAGSGHLLKQLAKNATVAAGPVGAVMSWIHPGFVNLRNYPKLWKSLLGFMGEQGKFIDKYYTRLDAMLQKAGKLSEFDWRAIWAKLEGWDRPNSILQRKYPEVGKDAIFTDLDRRMSEPARVLAREMEMWYKDMWKETGAKFNNSRQAFASLGVEIGGEVDAYIPHMTRFNRYENSALLNVITQRGKYSAIIDKITENGIAGSFKKRSGYTIPDIDEFTKMVEILGGRPNAVTGLKAAINREAEIMAGLIRRSHDIARAVPERDKAVVAFIRDFIGTTRQSGIRIDMRVGKIKRAAIRMSEMIGDRLLSLKPGSQEFENELMDAARALAFPAMYPMDLKSVSARYLHAAAPTWAWWTQGYRAKILGPARRLTGWQEKYVMDELLPILRGNKHYKEYSRNVTFGEIKYGMYKWLRDSKEMKALLPEGSKKWLLNYMKDTSNLTMGSIGSMISHQLYLSTLGLNLSPALQNSLQNLLTTANIPGIGLRNLWRGYAEATSRIEKYIEYRRQGKTSDEALKLAAPDFVAEMGQSATILRTMMAGDVGKEGMLLPEQARTFMQKAKGVMLGPFAGTEMLNRLSGFYAGKIAAMRMGMSAAEAAGVGRDIVVMAHFSGGPLGMPRALLGMWAPLRQYLHFPLRYASYLSASTRWGEDPGKWYGGTIGKAMLGSTAMYYGAKNLLGLDLSRGLMFGALPVPDYERAPFYPYPLVPPAVSVAGGLASSILKGDKQEFAECFV